MDFCFHTTNATSSIIKNFYFQNLLQENQHNKNMMTATSHIDTISINEKGTDNHEVPVDSGGCCASIKQFFFYDNHRRDIQAFYFNQFGHSALAISVVFLSFAVLEFTNKQAGCPQNDNGTYQNCENKVYGLQPSSMLSLMSLIGGLATSIFMPYAGAVVDYSDHRLEFGRASAAILTAINFAQIFIFDNTWFIMLILQSVVAVASYMANFMVMWSYIRAPTDHDLHGITASGANWETFGKLSFFILVGGAQFGTGWDSITLARFSQGAVTVIGGISLLLAYRRYTPVKAVKCLEEGSNLYIAGLWELKSTMATLSKHQPGAARFLLASMFIEAGTHSLHSLAITYLTIQIGMTSTAITMYIAVNLLCHPFGVIIHRALSRKIGHKRSYIACNIQITIMIVLFVGTIYSPDHANIVFLFGLLIGTSFGWYFPCSNGYFVSLVPEEKVAELWGFNSFCSVVSSWVPPLIFTGLNESTASWNDWNNPFLVIGIAIAITIPEKHTSNEDDTAMKKTAPANVIDDEWDNDIQEHIGAV